MKIRKERGFSLIEVLIAVTFLSVGILALASLQITSIRGNSFSSNLMQATYVAQDRLEYLKNLAINSTDLSSGIHNAGSVTLSGVVYNRSYTVVVNGKLLTINYTITWNDGTNHSVTFSTIRSQ